MSIRNTAYVGGLFLLVGGLAACLSPPTWSGRPVACERDADCRERFVGGGEVDPQTLYCDTSVGFCIQVPDRQCDTADECPVGSPGNGSWCDEGTWACNFGRCELSCVGCDVDEDHDGFGEGDGCAGLDCDDGNSSVHSRSLRQCYDGPEGTSGHGACRAGQQWCEEGIWAPCFGQVLPSGETCNGLDDDCDGETDQAVPLPGCGLGVCESQSSCVDGELVSCRLGLPATDGEGTVPNGEDDDCNGVVDDVVGVTTRLPVCIFVAPSGVDSPSNDGRDAAWPLGSLQDALAKARTQLSQARQSDPDALLSICMAGGSSCSTSPSWYYVDELNEPTAMVDGVSIVGSYESTTWTQCPDLTTLLLTRFPQGLLVPDAVQTPTALSRMVLRRGDADQIGLSVNGARNLTLSEVRIIPAEVSESVSVGLIIKGGAEVRASQLTVHGGAGVLGSQAIKVESSRLELSDSCTPDLNRGGCGSCGGEWETGIHGVSPSAGSANAIGIELIDAIGTTLDRVSICDVDADQSIGLLVTGSAEGVRLRQSTVEVVGADTSSIGALLYCSGGTAPEVAFNPSIFAEIEGTGSDAGATGIAVGRDCNAVIHHNLLIAGAVAQEDTFVSTGIVCEGVPFNPLPGDSGAASACQIVGNDLIQAGAEWASAQNAFGVFCGQDACARIEQNRIKGAHEENGAAHSAGLILLPGSRPLVARNQINGGCVDPNRNEPISWSAGVEASDSGARLENNAILGANCLGNTGWFSFGLLADARDRRFELDVNGNTIDGGGYGGLSVGVSFSTDPAAPVNRGIYRNNLIRAGRGLIGWAFGAANPGARPRTAKYNVAWLFPSSQVLAVDNSDPANPRNVINPVEAQALFGDGFEVREGDPQLQRPDSVPLEPQITSGSVCENAGTLAGAPTIDFAGEPRSDGQTDIGADEL